MMTPLSKHQGFVRLLLLLPLLFACQAAGGQTSAETPAPQEASVELELNLGPGVFFLSDPHVGLTQLSSYKATLIRSFAGSIAGEGQQWEETYVLVRTSDPAASKLTVERTGDNAFELTFLAEIDEIAYVLDGSGECSAEAVASEIPSIERLDPSGLISVLLGADEAGQEPVNDVAANHYTFDERALGKSGLEESAGEIWVAVDGGHILKYTLTTTGSSQAFGEGIEGSMTWDYTLTDINSPPTMDIPRRCLDLMISVPRLPDAYDVSNNPGWLSYKTSANVAEATTFYRQEIPALGWSVVTESTNDPTVSSLEYAREGQSLSLLILEGDEGTSVDILLSSSAE